MKTDLTKWFQSPVRSIGWVILMTLSVAFALLAAWKGSWSFVFMNTFITVVAYWCDQLEKEITRRNNEANK